MKTSTQDPLISVIIPVYNGERMLPETLRSVAAQSFTDYELIVVDDGSTDDTAGITARICPAASLLRQPNQGVAAARNHGVAEARGRWVTFLDADDLWHRDRLARLADFVGRNEDCLALGTTAVKFCLAGDAEQMRADGDWVDRAIETEADAAQMLSGPLPATPEILARLTHFDLLRGNRILSTGVLVDRKTLLCAGLFSLTSEAVADYDCWMRVARLTPVWLLDEPSFCYRVHASSMSRTREMLLWEMVMLLAQWFGSKNSPRRSPEDAGALADAAPGYADWQLREIIVRAVAARDAWSVKAALALGHFLLPNPALRRALRRTAAKEYVKRLAHRRGRAPSGAAAKKI